MDARDKNRYRALTTTQSVFESHKDDNTWSAVPALVKAVDDLETVVVSIAGYLELFNTPSGAAKAKTDCLDALVVAANEVAAGVHAYAVDNDDAELAAQVDFSATALRAGREPDIVSRCASILTLATANLDNLADYNITQAKLTALGKKTTAYEKACPKPRQNVATKSAATKALPGLFEKARKILDTRIDKLMVPFKTSAPDLFSEYQTARKIVDQRATQAQKKLANNVVTASGTAPLAKAA